MAILKMSVVMLSGAGPANVQYYKHKDILNIATA